MPTSEFAPPIISGIPFGLLLLLIAVLPLTASHFWESNRNKAIVAALVSAPILIYLLAQAPGELASTFHEYLSFIILLAALFVISGGILVTGDLRATPLVNTTFLLIGAILANLVGTTGASMILIRPLLETIRERKHIYHIPIFFIFVVSNISGCLTPLGDPPLYLGFLRGVPFTWTFRLFPIWLTAVAILLALFYAIDWYALQKETTSDLWLDRKVRKPLRIDGKINLLFLLGIILTVFFKIATPYRESVMIAMTILSWVSTPHVIREQNKFTFHPITEVAILFAGIFVTMVPLLAIMRIKGAALGIIQPWQFFWCAGGLSSFLDNAPTYLTFTSLAESVTRSLSNPAIPIVSGIGVRADLLQAISCGAVFMGANTYIGNGPNFMVKSIAEEQGFKVPHFFEYMLYSGVILLPLFLVLTVLFFR
jgi:Na+/H+ antiporter NhaD/arsenite permease-like protein